MKYKYKCDDFTARSSTTMAGYILSQCSPEDIITAWYNLLECAPALYDGECDFIIGKFGLGALILLYRFFLLQYHKTSLADLKRHHIFFLS